MILAGMLALVYPAISSVAVVFFIGWLLIFSGIFQGISLIGARHVPHFWLQLISVALFIVVGEIFLRNPGESLHTLTLLLIVFFLIEGISKVIVALTIRPFTNWGWVLVSVIIGILLAFYLWASIPVSAAWLLGVLLGIDLICEGAAISHLAWQVRKRWYRPARKTLAPIKRGALRHGGGFALKAVPPRGSHPGQ